MSISKCFLALPLLSLLLANTVVADQVISVRANPAQADLTCPAPVRLPVKPVVVSNPDEEPLEPPSPEEVAALNAEMTRARLAANTLNTAVRSKQGEPLRVAFWGDSHLAASFFTDELIRQTGLARQQVLPTFIPPTMGRVGIRLPIQKYCRGGGWSLRVAHQSKVANASFAPGLSWLQSEEAGSYLWVDFRLPGGGPSLNRLDILLTSQRTPVVLGVTVDNGEEQLLEVAAENVGKLTLQPDQPMSSIKLRLVEGGVAIEGFVPHYASQVGLQLDVFGFPGATARGWGLVNPDYLSQRLAVPQYDLVVLEYGTNEGNVRKLDALSYRDDLRASLSNVRKVFPTAQCVLIGPTDRGIRVRHPRKTVAKKSKVTAATRAGKKTIASTKTAPSPVSRAPTAELLRFSRVHEEIGEIQREVGAEFSCQFWSWQDAMGGPGGAYRWFYETPRMMAPDLVHLTIPGYQHSARKFAEALNVQDWSKTFNAAPN